MRAIGCCSIFLLYMFSLVKPALSQIEVETHLCRNKARKICAQRQEKGYCEKLNYRKWMATNCMRSCGLCPSDKCEDRLSKCSLWAERGQCMHERMQEYMEIYCPESCGLCSNTTTSAYTTAQSTTVDRKTTETATTEATTVEITTAETTTAEIPTTTHEVKSTASYFGSVTMLDTLTTSESEGTTASVTKQIVTVEPCVDVFNTCERFKDYCMHGAMKMKCRKTCGACPTASTSNSLTLTSLMTSQISATTTSHSPQETTESVNNTTEQQPDCIDSFKQCTNLKSYCDKNANIQTNCRKTCGVCTTSTTSVTPVEATAFQDCADSFKQCTNLKSYCDKNVNIQKNCRKTCGLCTISTTNVSPVEATTSKDCIDSFKECTKVQSYCKTNVNVQKSCKKTCGLCTTFPATVAPVETTTLQDTWTEWSECSVTCGGGIQSRTKICNGISNCKNGQENRPCATVDCSNECVDRTPACKTYKHKGLCASSAVSAYCCASCTVPKENTDDTSSHCKDKHDLCPTWANGGFCNGADADFMNKTCQKSCNLCANSWSEWSSCSSPCGGGVQKRTLTCYTENCDPKNETKDCNTHQCERCADRSPICKAIEKLGKCSSNTFKYICPKTCKLCLPKPMSKGQCYDTLKSCMTTNVQESCSNDDFKVTCPSTCGICKKLEETSMDKAPETSKNSMTNCTDSSDLCPIYKQRGYCTKHKEISQVCQKSCGTCGVDADENGDSCIDDKETCRDLIAEHTCGNPFVQQSCRKTCGVCGRQVSSNGRLMTDSQTMESAQAKLIAAQKCQDRNNNCVTWAKETGANRKCNQAFYQFVCAKSCQKKCQEETGEIEGHNLQCKDLRHPALCSAIKQQNHCHPSSSMYNTVKNLCRKTCELCSSEVESLSTTESPASSVSPTSVTQATHAMTTAKPVTVPTSSESAASGVVTGQLEEYPCEDVTSTCDPMKCNSTKQNWYPFICAKSCGKCMKRGRRTETRTLEVTQRCDPDPEVCKQIPESYCQYSRMQETCQNRCKMCEKTSNPIEDSDCMDYLDECSNYKNLCDVSPSYTNYMTIMCPRTCEKCDTSSNRNASLPAGTWSVWGTWSECSKTCNDVPGPLTSTSGGRRTRKRTCPENHYCEGTDIEEGICSKDYCPDLINRNGTCADRSSMCAEHQQEGRCESQIYRHQMQAQCAVTCGLCEDLTWSSWSECNATCGGSGYRSRTKICDSLIGCEQSANETQEIEACQSSVQGPCYSWASWSNWTQCSEDCGQAGKMSRTRQCYRFENGETSVADSSSSEFCIGLSSEENLCNQFSCPEWESWSSWTDCSKSCDSGERSRTRNCQLSDGNISLTCSGNNTETEACNCHICDTTGVWSTWGEYSSCSETCGNSTKTRERFCINGLPGRGNCIGEAQESAKCVQPQCGQWSTWSDWSECSTSCGLGVRIKDRQCIGDTACIGTDEMVEECELEQCRDARIEGSTAE